MNAEELMGLRDVTPRIRHRVTKTLDGRNVNITFVDGFAGALFQEEQDGDFMDANGVWWQVGVLIGERVRRVRPG